jgi:hypothetical protein
VVGRQRASLLQGVRRHGQVAADQQSGGDVRELVRDVARRQPAADQQRAVCMGVMVTSKVTKSGSTIGGQFAHIVVVKTNPGYAPDPSDHGTGTIVASYC